MKSKTKCKHCGSSAHDTSKHPDAAQDKKLIKKMVKKKALK